MLNMKTKILLVLTLEVFILLSGSDSVESSKREAPNVKDGILENDGMADMRVSQSRKKRASDGQPLNLTSDEQQLILDLHNDHRRNVSPEASNMEFMVSISIYTKGKLFNDIKDLNMAGT